VCYNYQCIGVLEDMLAEVYTKALLIKRLHEQPAQPPTVEQLKRGLKYVAGASSTVAQWLNMVVLTSSSCGWFV
jgi:hypothetical protein